MEEKFSVSLELMIQKFKDKAKQVQDVSKNVASKIKENMSVNVGGGAFKSMTAESELLLNKINDIKSTLSSQNVGTFKLSKQETMELRSELEKLEKQYSKTNQGSNMFGNSFNKIQDGMNKSLKSAKRFALSLFGIQSGIRLISRASSAYASVDEENTRKVNSAWIGLGAMFASMREVIANFVIKAVSYINVFIKALTGTDFLANAMAKSMNKANKSAGKLSKTLAGFDELTNIDADIGSPDVDTSWIEDFKNVQLNPEVVKFFEKLGKSLKPINDGLKDIFDKFDGYEYSVYLLGIALAAVFGGKSLIITMALVGGAIVISELKEVKKQMDIVRGATQDQTEKQKDLNKAILDKVDADELSNESTKNVIDNTIESTKRTLAHNDQLKESRGILDSLLGFGAKRIEQIEENNKLIGEEINFLVELSKKGKLDEEQKKRLIDLMAKQKENYEFLNDRLKTNSKEYKENSKQIETLEKNMKSISNGNYEAVVKVNADTKPAKTGLSKFFSGLESLGSNIMSFFGIDKVANIISKIASFDVGTDYVPRDMLAVVHEGEKITPKKFNSQNYTQNNDETNNLLRTLIETLEEKDMSVNIDKKAIGQASADYIKSQSRIMGRGVI